jgi:O-antigen/teichoic acid export membrane protein
MLEPFALMITTANRQHVRLCVVLIATCLNGGLNYFAIRGYGAFGAGVVSLITNAFVAIAYFVACSTLFYKWILNSRTLLLFLVCAALALVCNYFGEISVFIVAPLTMLSFSLFGFFFLISGDEKRIIFSKRDGTAILK